MKVCTITIWQLNARSYLNQVYNKLAIVFTLFGLNAEFFNLDSKGRVSIIIAECSNSYYNYESSLLSVSLFLFSLLILFWGKSKSKYYKVDKETKKRVKILKSEWHGWKKRANRWDVLPRTEKATICRLKRIRRKRKVYRLKRNRGHGILDILHTHHHVDIQKNRTRY